MRLPEVWDDWVVYDDKGISGIRDDAPDEIKKAFKKWQDKQQKDSKSQQLKI